MHDVVDISAFGLRGAVNEGIVIVLTLSTGKAKAPHHNAVHSTGIFWGLWASYHTYWVCRTPKAHLYP